MRNIQKYNSPLKLFKKLGLCFGKISYHICVCLLFFARSRGIYTYNSVSTCDGWNKPQTNLKPGAILLFKLKNVLVQRWCFVRGEPQNRWLQVPPCLRPATTFREVAPKTHQNHTWSCWDPKFLGTQDFQLYLHLTYTVWGRVLFLTRCCLKYGRRAHQVSTRNTDNAPSLRKVLWEVGLMSHFVRTSLQCWLTRRGGDTLPTNLNGLHVAKCARPR